MEKKTKIVIVSLSVISGLMFCVAAAFALVLINERSRSVDAQSQLEVANDARRIAEDELVKIKGQISDMETSLADATAKTTVLQNDLNKELSSKNNLQIQLNEKNKQMSVLQQQYDKLLEEKKNLEQQSKASETEVPIVAKEAAEISPAPGEETSSKLLEGEVLVINKDYNFIVINIGRKSGVAEGDSFTIMNDSKVIGKAVVQKIYDTMSSANLSAETDIANISKGNKVIKE